LSNHARLLFALLLLAGLAVGYFATRASDHTDWILCAQQYAAARSTEDTAQIDMAPAPRERGRGDYSASAMITCGELRSQQQTPEAAT
jgi:hypothetical protein